MGRYEEIWSLESRVRRSVQGAPPIPTEPHLSDRRTQRAGHPDPQLQGELEQAKPFAGDTFDDAIPAYSHLGGFDVFEQEPTKSSGKVEPDAAFADHHPSMMLFRFWKRRSAPNLPRGSRLQGFVENRGRIA